MNNNRKGFTLIEMLVVIGIIIILVGASIGAFSKMTKSAEHAKAQELVSNAATALTVYFQKEGCWPKRILTAVGSGDGRLDENIGLIIAKKGLFSLSMNSDNSKLVGVDRFGIVSPWAAATIKRYGNDATKTTKVMDTQSSIGDHVLHFSVDIDGDGVVDATVGGVAIKIRATAAVWCGGKNGYIEPYPYAGGSSKTKKGGTANASKSSGRYNAVYSWVPGQTKNVKD